MLFFFFFCVFCSFYSWTVDLVFNHYSIFVEGKIAGERGVGNQNQMLNSQSPDSAMIYDQQIQITKMKRKGQRFFWKNLNIQYFLFVADFFISILFAYVYWQKKTYIYIFLFLLQAYDSLQPDLYNPLVDYQDFYNAIKKRFETRHLERRRDFNKGQWELKRSKKKKYKDIIL